MARSLTLLAVLLAAAPAAAHEPVFAPGPHVPGQGIYGFELEDTYDREHELETTLHYGPTPDSEAGIKIRNHLGSTRSGLADLGLQYKDRFWRHDEVGAQTAAAAVVAVDLPTGDKSRGFGRGAYGVRLAATVGTEQLVYSGWAALEAGMKDVYSAGPGRAEWGGLWTRASLIGGRRLYEPKNYRDWDFPIYFSAHYTDEGPQRFAGANLPDTGGRTLTVGPSILPGKRFLMARLGVQFPVWERLRGGQMKTPVTTKAVFEVHF